MSSFSIDIKKLNSLGIIDPTSPKAMEAFEKHHFTGAERLFFKLWGTEDLNMGYFAAGQKLAERGEQPNTAYVIISGEVEGRDHSGSYQLGPGSVLGLAEGLSRKVYEWDAFAKSDVTTKVIPLEKALREVRGLNAGLKGICRSTAMRILNLSSPPESLS